MKNADKFKNIFGLYATELWSMPEKDFLKWLNSEAMNCSEFPNNSDTISRQAAIRWVKTECNPYGKPTLEFESGKKVIEHLEQMPSAQPEIIRCRECKYKHLEDMVWNCPFGLPGEEDFFCAYGAKKETDCDYERAVEQLEHDMLYEPTFNQDDGSM